MRVKYGVQEDTQSLHLHSKFYLNMFTVSASGDEKAEFWANFAFWDTPVLTPF